MILFESAGEEPQPAEFAGFVPRKSEDAVARQLLRPCFPDESEAVLLAGFDGYERLVRLERVNGDGIGRCSIPPRCWRALLGCGIATVLMAHNHPSGTASPSDADVRCTRETAHLLRLLDIELIDHLIFVDSGHFSFRQAQLM